MSEKLGDWYNKLYASHEIVFGRGLPEQLVTEIPKFVERGSVLDIGGGEGRNAMFLAENGYDVEVIDLAESGLEKINTIAGVKGLNNIRTRVGDVREDGIQNEYMAIVSSFMLHHLTRAEAQKLISEMKVHTKVGGVNVISGFMDGFYSPPKDRFCPHGNELSDLYKDWEIREYREEESRSREIGEDGEYKMAKTAYLLAQKPLRGSSQ